MTKCDTLLYNSLTLINVESLFIEKNFLNSLVEVCFAAHIKQALAPIFTLLLIQVSKF